MKDLSSVTKKEQNEFIASFDHVFCDIDGVIWHSQKTIPGVLQAISSLQGLGKKVIFVSNNSTKTQETCYNQLKSAGYNIEKTDVIQPALAIVDFLKKHNVTKNVYLVGMTPLRTQLEEAGFTVEQFHLENPEESVVKYITSCVAPNINVGAAVVDLDVNMNASQLQRAATLLKDPAVLFITGGSDKRLCYGPGQILIGPGEYHDVLKDVTGRKPACLAKPTREFGDFINKKFDVKDPGKVLFIGDSIPEDMGFATNCGYQKLLVLSGLTTINSIKEWTHPEQYKPKYYVESVKVLQDILCSN